MMSDSDVLKKSSTKVPCLMMILLFVPEQNKPILLDKWIIKTYDIFKAVNVGQLGLGHHLGDEESPEDSSEEEAGEVEESQKEPAGGLEGDLDVPEG